MPFFPNSSLYSKNYPRNINYIPVVVFFVCLDFEKIAILGQPPSGFFHPGPGKKHLQMETTYGNGSIIETCVPFSSDESRLI